MASIDSARKTDGGSANAGTVFALNLNNTNFTVLPTFTAANYDANLNLTNRDGANPNARLPLSSDTPYGTVNRGGTGGQGTIFTFNTNSTDFTVLHSFTAGNYDPNIHGNNLTSSDGANPRAGLIFSGNTFYGTASAGGSEANGTVFSLSLVPAPQLTILDRALE